PLEQLLVLSEDLLLKLVHAVDELLHVCTPLKSLFEIRCRVRRPRALCARGRRGWGAEEGDPPPGWRCGRWAWSRAARARANRAPRCRPSRCTASATRRASPAPRGRSSRAPPGGCARSVRAG